MRARAVAALVLLAACGHSSHTTSYTMAGRSMEPTVRVSDHAGCTTKLPERLPRASVLAFTGDRVWGEGKVFVKRLVGLPGETISSDENGTVSVDGTPIDESYADPGRMAFGPVRLGPDDYFVMGDNRPMSADSRVNGPIHRDAILATCTRIVSPPSHRGHIAGTP